MPKRPGAASLGTAAIEIWDLFVIAVGDLRFQIWQLDQP
jgi:hypothetical protein